MPASQDSTRPQASASTGAPQQSIVPSALTRRSTNAGDPTPESPEAGGGSSSGGTAQAGATGPGPGGGLDFVPSVSLPKGGGALRSIGEKFQTSAFTGTAGMTVPIFTSPGRALSPGLGLAYNSGAGNGPFGLGWQLSAPMIARKTDEGLPEYNDAHHSDVFVLSDAEDLVPLLELDSDGHWQPPKPRLVDDQYLVYAYRPRVEGSFARIERWVDKTSGETHWHTWTADNMRAVYGFTPKARVFDPERPERVYGWKLEAKTDDRGNAMVFEYKPEDFQTEGQDDDPRDAQTEIHDSQRYLKRIFYGRVTMLDLPEDTSDPDPNADPPVERDPLTPDPKTLLASGITPEDWHFEVVFDYGDHDGDTPEADAEAWYPRPDPFSNYRPGFEVRTHRLCRRVMMFHRFDEALNEGAATLVRSTEFYYRPIDIDPTSADALEVDWKPDLSDPDDRSNHVAVQLHGVLQRAYRDGDDDIFPPLRFQYSEARIDDTMHTLPEATLDHLPSGIDGQNYRFVDVDGEGLPGILSEMQGEWYYKEPLGDGRFGAVKTLPTLPRHARLAGGTQLVDLDGDGQKSLVDYSGPTPGFIERHGIEGDWRSFRPFQHVAQVNTQDPFVQLIDLNGDGFADLLVDDDDRYIWYPSQQKAGFEAPRIVPKPRGQDLGPQRVYSSLRELVSFADMTGDGLQDIVRITREQVEYWPSLGHGRFGGRVLLSQETFDTAERFHIDKIRLGDIDGSGPTDLIYMDNDGVAAYINEAGNRLRAAQPLKHFPPVDQVAHAQLVDLFGDGTACLVYSTASPHARGRQLQFLRLMAEGKPYLLKEVDNGVGGRTRVQYGTSVQHYLRDKIAGTPWATRLAFPVQVVDKVEVHDALAQRRFTNRYAYHHGYFDGLDREFRGFGRVEQFDTEDFGVESLFEDDDDAQGTQTAPEYMPPVRTVTWFHLGASLQRADISQQFAQEYFRESQFEADDRPQLGDSVLVGQIKDRHQEDGSDHIPISGQNIAEAYRCLRGRPLRVEVYADDAELSRFDFDDNLDGTPQTAVDRELRAQLPYSVTETNFSVYQIQPRDNNRGQHGVFLATDRETLARHYERTWTANKNERFDPRTSHSMVLDVNRHGVPLQTLAIGYGRRSAHTPPGSPDSHPERRTTFIYSESEVFDHDDRTTHRDFRLSLPVCSSSYELVGELGSVDLGPSDDTTLFQIKAGFAAALKGSLAVHHNDDGSGGGLKKRLLSREHTVYYNEAAAIDENSTPLPLGEAGPHALVHHSRSAVMSLDVAQQTWGEEGLVADVTTLMLEAGYVALTEASQIKDPLLDPQLWWRPSARQLPDPTDFYLSKAAVDPLNGELYSITYDFSMFVATTTDPFGNINSATYDYVALAPTKVTDPNGTSSEVRFDTRSLVERMFVTGDSGQGPVGDSETSPTVQYTYNLEAWYKPVPGTEPGPVSVKVQTRRRHATPDILSSETVLRHSRESEEDEHLITYTYSDGSGGIILEKVQAEAGGSGWRLNGDGEFEFVESIEDRWLGSGRTIVDNKGNPVRQYEPYFVEGFQFDSEPALVQSGVSPEFVYDAAGRNTKTIFPNGTLAKVRFSPWRTESFDPNDLIESTDPDNTWLTDIQTNLPTTDPQYQAAQRARAHHNTPSVTDLDSLGRAYRSEQNDGTDTIETETTFDVEGNVLKVTTRDVQRHDLSGNPLTDLHTIVATEHTYAMAGFVLTSHSRDAGPTWALPNILGNPVYQWDRRDDLGLRDGDPPDPTLLRTRRMTFDRMQRPVDHFLKLGADPEQLLERIVYGESRAIPDATSANQLGRVYRVYDGAGVATLERYDFKGNPVQQSRTLAKLPSGWETSLNPAPDWSAIALDETIDDMEDHAASLLEDSLAVDYDFHSRSHSDALGRVFAAVSPDGSTTSYAYNRAGLLEAVEVTHVHDTEARSVVKNINYNERGQRLKIVYGEGEDVPERRGTTTDYAYEASTFRLVGIHSYVSAQTPPASSASLQFLQYTYDPVGNIARVYDEAVDTVYSNNLAVEPEHIYVYDALYRLTQATGREHTSQGRTAPSKHSHHTPQPLPLTSDGEALRTYTQDYVYDKLGNFLTMSHTAHGATGDSWTRYYAYEEDSNRLTATQVKNAPTTGAYVHNVHGQMTAMPGQAVMAWGGKDELAVTSTGPGTAVQGYTYGLDGQRVRKVDLQPGGVTWHERIYLGGFEILRRYDSSGLDEEIETLHVSDDMGRVCVVETKTHHEDTGAVANPVPKWRFQLGNHLGSVSMEVSEDGTPISFEEYHPYGTTAYSSTASWSDVSAKRYRYTGKERDEETGLYYHGARYYAPWLGRWTASDPIGLGDGLNRFAYVGGNPIALSDPSGTRGENRSERRRAEKIVAEKKASLPGGEDHARSAVLDHIRATQEAGVTGKLESNLEKSVVDAADATIAQQEADEQFYNENSKKISATTRSLKKEARRRFRKARKQARSWRLRKLSSNERIERRAELISARRDFQIAKEMHLAGEEWYGRNVEWSTTHYSVDRQSYGFTGALPGLPRRDVEGGGWTQASGDAPRNLELIRAKITQGSVESVGNSHTHPPAGDNLQVGGSPGNKTFNTDTSTGLKPSANDLSIANADTSMRNYLIDPRGGVSQIGSHVSDADRSLRDTPTEEEVRENQEHGVPFNVVTARKSMAGRFDSAVQNLKNAMTVERRVQLLRLQVMQKMGLPT